MGFGDFASHAVSMLGGQLADALAGGGQLVKAMLVLLPEDKKAQAPDKLEFPINPESVTITDVSLPSTAPNTGGGKGTTSGGGKEPRTISFTVVFDTYEARKDVRVEYINKLQKFARPDPELHINPSLLFVWGNLSADEDIAFPVDLEEFQVTYTMFLPDGTPVRCSVDLTLKEVTDPDTLSKLFQSPDHAKLHTVKRGDTLQSISFKEYDTPGEWRRIADANGIDDPLQLEPGTRLLVPPILR